MCEGVADAFTEWIEKPVQYRNGQHDSDGVDAVQHCHRNLATPQGQVHVLSLDEVSWLHLQNNIWLWRSSVNCRVSGTHFKNVCAQLIYLNSLAQSMEEAKTFF